jgi:hypothetical protein
MVEAILDKQVIKVNGRSQTRYLVKWLGYPLEEATWEPAYNLMARDVKK